MQEKSERRSNADRTAETRAKLIAAARALFVEKGYADTGTPEIVRKAEITRGALYHHFADKADLFRAVLMAEAIAVAKEIARSSLEAKTPQDGIAAGAAAYFKAMKKAGRARILLLDGPAVLGADEMARIDAETGGGELAKGLQALLPATTPDVIDALSATLSAGFDNAALRIAGGSDPGTYMQAMSLILDALAERQPA